MKGVLVLLMGNLASGKSSLIEAVKPDLKDSVNCLGIDEYRTLYEAHTYENETKAWTSLMSDVSESENVLLETSGTSKWIKEIKASWTGLIISVHLKTPEHVCANRFSDRRKSGYKSPPMPFFKPFDKAIKDIGSLLMFENSEYTIDGTLPEDIASKYFYCILEQHNLLA